MLDDKVSIKPENSIKINTVSFITIQVYMLTLQDYK